jgi:hypothetical protein
MGAYDSLKAIWKKLGVNGQIKNFSSTELWVLETDSGIVAKRLPSGYKTPATVDVDAFKRVDGSAIEGHKNWWKIYDFSTVEIFGSNKSLAISAVTKTAVEEDHFGRPIYKNEIWGSKIQLISDVRRDQKKRIVEYYVTSGGWIDSELAFRMTCNHEIDNARPVFPKSGEPYIRTRRDPQVFNNISSNGKA